MRTILLITFLSFSTLLANAQTGPGGVGNSSNNIQWVDAGSLTGVSSGTQVSTFPDLSGNGYDFVQASSARQPLYLSSGSNPNSMPALAFDGANDQLQVGAIPEYSTNQIQWFIVGMSNNLSGVGMLVGSRTNASNSAWATFRSGGIYNTNTRSSSGSFVGVSLGTPAGVNIFHSNWQGQTASFSAFLNGNLAGSATGANANSAHVLTRLGGSPYGSGTYYLNGEISEFFSYTGQLNTAQQKIIYNYLGAKYGISVANYMYAWGVSHFHEVAGVGRDNASNQHTDAQGNSLLRIHSPSNLDNGEYLFWGHDNAGLGQNFTNMPASYGGNGARFNQVWRASESGGDVGTVTMIWDLSASSIGDPNSYELLIDADGDFSSGSTGHTGTYNAGSNTLTFTGINFSHGDYFTLANSSQIISITSGDWENPSTWNCNCIPGNAAAVTIDTSDVVTITTPVTIGQVTMALNSTLTFNASGASLTILRDIDIAVGALLDASSNNNPISIGGDWNSLGNFNPRLGAVTFNGGAAQGLSGPGPTPFYDLVIDNPTEVAITSGAFNLVNEMTIMQGNFNTNNNPFTLISDPTGTAAILAIPTGSAVLGNVNVQRYISAGNADYREMSPPVNGAILSMWDSPSVYMSGPGFPDGCAYDANGNCFASVKTWDYLTQDYVDMTDYNAPLDNLQGYMMFMALDLNTFPGTTLRDVVGTINTPGTLTRFLPGAGGDWHFIGNPYAATIDWDLVTKSGIYNQFYIWDQSTGQYEYYSSGTSSGGNISSLGLIASGQGFWVEKFGYSENNFVAFEQNDKVSLYTPFVRKRNPYQNDEIKLELFSKETPLKGNTAIVFHEEAETTRDARDIRQLKSPLDNFVELTALTEDGKKVRLNALPRSTDKTSVNLVVNVSTAGRYYIRSKDFESFMAYTCVTAEDLSNGKLYNMLTSEVFPIDVEANATSPSIRLHFSNENCNQNIVAGTEQFTETNAVKIFGNQVEFSLHEASNAKITVFNLTGQQVLTEEIQSISTGTVKLKTEHLNSGMYLVLVETPEKNYTAKVFFNKSRD